MKQHTINRNLHDTVTNMMIDMDEEDRQKINCAVIEGRENLDDFIRYMLITIDSIGNDLNALLIALDRTGLISVRPAKVVEDGDPSA